MVMTDSAVDTSQRPVDATMAPTPTTPSDAAASEPPADLLPEGARVEVRSTLDQRWSGGFVVVSASSAGYRLQRSSDEVLLPSIVPVQHVRRERKRNTWWM